MNLSSNSKDFIKPNTIEIEIPNKQNLDQENQPTIKP